MSPGFAAAVRPAKVIAFGSHRFRALTMPVDLAVTGHFPHYNAARLRSSIGHLTAADFLAGLIE